MSATGGSWMPAGVQSASGVYVSPARARFDAALVEAWAAVEGRVNRKTGRAKRPRRVETLDPDALLRLGMEPHEWIEFVALPDARTRAEFVMREARFGTPVELQERLELVLRAAGVSGRGVEDFRRTHSPEVFAGRGWFDDGTGSAPGTETKPHRIYPEARQFLAYEEAIEKVARLIGRSGSGNDPRSNADTVMPADGVFRNLLATLRRYHARVSPEELFERVFGGGRAKLMPLLSSHLGVHGGRPFTVERMAREVGATEREVVMGLEWERQEHAYGIPEEELRNAVAAGVGRRYLWPDERGTPRVSLEKASMEELLVMGGGIV